MAITKINVITYDTPGTYTYVPSVGMRNVIIEVMGAGGATATVFDNTIAISIIGGGAGGYCKSIYSASFIEHFSVVTVGAGGVAPLAISGAAGGPDGGDSSFGPLMLAAGGKGCVQGSVQTVAYGSNPFGSLGTGGPGGNGGIASGGNIVNVEGQWAGSLICLQGTIDSFATAGGGGSTIYGAGGSPQAAYGANPIRNVGNSASGFGSGGGGGASSTVAPTKLIDGSSGSDGLVIITEYIRL